MLKIYFNTKCIIISTNSPGEADKTNNLKLVEHWDETITIDLIEAIQGPESGWIWIQFQDPEAVFESIKKQFTVIQAAGGLVTAPDNDMLLIFRKGKWDLPKGKLDDGENIEDCAVREVEEETGLQHVQLKQLLMRTFHTYKENDTPILKETFWYQMDVKQKQELTPQKEEDILECKWVNKEDLSLYMLNMQPSVIDVLENFQ